MTEVGRDGLPPPTNAAAVHPQSHSTQPSCASKPRSDAILARGESISLARRAAATAKKRREEARAELERRGVREGMDSALEGIVGRSASTRANVSQNKVKRSKRVKWNKKEVDALQEGVTKYGEGRWAVILREYASCFNQCRISVDLKDKWRNLYKAHRGLAAHQPQQSPLHKPPTPPAAHHLYPGPTSQPHFPSDPLPVPHSPAATVTHDAPAVKTEAILVTTPLTNTAPDLRAQHPAPHVQLSPSRVSHPSRCEHQLHPSPPVQIFSNHVPPERGPPLRKQSLQHTPDHVVAHPGSVARKAHVQHAAHANTAVTVHYDDVQRRAQAQQSQPPHPDSFAEHAVAQGASILEDMQHVASAQPPHIQHSHHGQLSRDIQHVHLHHHEHHLVGEEHHVAHCQQLATTKVHSAQHVQARSTHVRQAHNPTPLCHAPATQPLTAVHHDQNLEHIHARNADHEQQLLLPHARKPEFVQFDHAADHSSQAIRKMECETVVVAEEHDDGPSVYHSPSKSTNDGRFMDQGQEQGVTHEDQHHHHHHGQPVHTPFEEHEQPVIRQQEAVNVQTMVDGAQPAQDDVLMTEAEDSTQLEERDPHATPQHVQPVAHIHKHYADEHHHAQGREQLIEQPEGHYGGEQQALQHDQPIHHEEVLHHSPHEEQEEDTNHAHCSQHDQQMEHDESAERSTQLVQEGRSLDNSEAQQEHETPQHAEHDGQHHTTPDGIKGEESAAKAQTYHLQSELGSCEDAVNEGACTGFEIMSPHTKVEAHELGPAGASEHIVPVEGDLDEDEVHLSGECQHGHYAANCEESGPYHPEASAPEQREQVEEHCSVQIRGMGLVLEMGEGSNEMGDNEFIEHDGAKQVESHEQEQGHEYEHEEEHEHEFEHAQEPLHEEEHEHLHEQEHVHGHDHDQIHEQEDDQMHELEQGHVHEEEHGHIHEQEHGHIHEQEHDVDRGHLHEEEHDHMHEHAHEEVHELVHEEERENMHVHEHLHGEEFEHVHEQVHEDEDVHEHEHEEVHEHVDEQELEHGHELRDEDVQRHEHAGLDNMLHREGEQGKDSTILHEQGRHGQATNNQAVQAVVVEVRSEVSDGRGEVGHGDEHIEVEASIRTTRAYSDILVEERNDEIQDEGLEHVDTADGIGIDEAVCGELKEARDLEDETGFGSAGENGRAANENIGLEEEEYVRHGQNGDVLQGNESGEEAEHGGDEEYSMEVERRAEKGELAHKDGEYRDRKDVAEGELGNFEADDGIGDRVSGRSVVEDASDDVHGIEGGGGEEVNLSGSLHDDLEKHKTLVQGVSGTDKDRTSMGGAGEKETEVGTRLEFERNGSNDKGWEQGKVEMNESDAAQVNGVSRESARSEWQGEIRGLKRGRNAVENEGEEQEVGHESGGQRQKARVECENDCVRNTGKCEESSEEVGKLQQAEEGDVVQVENV